MPRLNGLDVLAWLKEHDDYQRVPKILLSGSLLRRKAGCKLLQTESQRCPSCWATSASISATCTVRRNAKDESRRAEGTGHAGSVAR
jgi:hypothetical protein